MGLFSKAKQAMGGAAWPATGIVNPVPLIIDPSGRSALQQAEAEGKHKISVVDLKKDHVDLGKKFDKAGLALGKGSLNGVRAQFVMVVDRSGSMSYRYDTGEVQMLVERGLAFGLNIDLDGTSPVIPFGSDVYPPIDVDITNYQGVVDREISRLRYGSTNLSAALKEVRKIAAVTDAPLFVLVVADGGADDPDEVIEIVDDLARFPAGLCFTGIDSAAYGFLDRIDKAQGRLVDNAWVAKLANPGTISDLDFADRVINGEPEPGAAPGAKMGFAKWIEQATPQGLLLPSTP
jgi:hypothetical protein